MKLQLFLSLLLVSASMLCGCTDQHPIDISDNVESYTEEKTESNIEISVPDDTQIETEFQEAVLVMTINGIPLDVIWEENETVAEMLAYAQSNPIMVNTTIYGNFEQVGSLPQNFSRNDVQMTAKPGDIVLYSGNQLVVFFGSNSWNYTKLGHINLMVDELTELLSGKTAIIEIKTIASNCQTGEAH